MNKKTLPITMDELLARPLNSGMSADAASVRFDREPAWNRLPSPDLQPDEQALHDALLGIAHPEGDQALTQPAPSMPAEVFLG